MRDDRYLDPDERAERDELEQAIADLLGEYIARREHSHLVRVDDLAAQAAQLGHLAQSALRFAIHFYETNQPAA